MRDNGMKICILSMQRVSNFGSLLQSYSLKKIIEEMGHDVAFIDIQKNEQDDALMNGKRHCFISEEEGDSGFISKLRKVDRYTLNRIHIKQLWKYQGALNEKFRRDVLNIRKEDNKKSYDICVIGSDEVFNCMTPANWGFTSQLFGNIPQAGKVITYAASCGATVYSELPEAVQNKIREEFQVVSALSARDQNTEDFIRCLTDKNVICHSDPVVVGDLSKELEVSSLPDGLPAHYCIIYSYYNRFHKKEEIKLIQEFCRKAGLEPVGLGAPQMWIKNNLAVSPFEVLAAFKKADFIITDTFHGTILSAKFNGRFAVMLRGSNKNKLGDLISRLNIENHVIDDCSELESAYLQPDLCDFQIISQVEREKTIKYLSENLI